MLYYDCESEKYYTLQELQAEYEQRKYEIYLDCGAVNFWEALRCALSKNGSLEEVPEENR